MPKTITFVLTVVLGAGLTAGFASPSTASVASSKNQFCKAVSEAGGTALFAEAAASGQGAANLAAPLQALGKDASSKSLKSAVKTLTTTFKAVGQGKSLSDLGVKNVATFNKAMTSFVAFVATNCTSATSSSTTPSTASGLSGTWSGQYTGASQGTFSLTWQQSGSDLTGTIDISELGSTINITGKLAGDKITFGTVGSLAITYTGSVSGNTMSGTYQAPTGAGTWNATKTA